MIPLPLDQRWTPNPIWPGKPAYLIGGGSSLRTFDFNLLKGHNTIGCNAAFNLGPEIVKWLCFSDTSWFNKNIHQLKDYVTIKGGKAVSCSTSLAHMRLPWLYKMQRETSGLHFKDGVIGWNWSTGAMAINLALYFKAGPIYLLGYDMAPSPENNKTHWHNHYAKTTNRAAFERHLEGFVSIQKGLAALFPAVKVFNVTDGESKLTGFDRITFADFKNKLAQEKL